MQQRVNIIYFLLIIVLLSNCRTMNSFSVVVEKIELLDSLPSGSGLVHFNDIIYIIGDDATQLYKLNPSESSFSGIPLNNMGTEYRINKPDKHDFESLEILDIRNEPHLIAFGSGSLSPQRDFLLVVNCKNEKIQQLISLELLYTLLKQQAGGKKILNIEGAVITGEKLYLMDRENDILFEIELEEFRKYILSNGNHKVSTVKIYSLQLPSDEGLIAGISGGCALSENKILFCASLEDTPNAIDDGVVKGSYIGIISLRDGNILTAVLLKDEQGIVIPDKIESIDIVGKNDDGTLKAFAVADNDDGSSKFYQLKISYSQ